MVSGCWASSVGLQVQDGGKVATRADDKLAIAAREVHLTVLTVRNSAGRSRRWSAPSAAISAILRSLAVRASAPVRRSRRTRMPLARSRRGPSPPAERPRSCVRAVALAQRLAALDPVAPAAQEPAKRDEGVCQLQACGRALEVRRRRREASRMSRRGRRRGEPRRAGLTDGDGRPQRLASVIACAASACARPRRRACGGRARRPRGPRSRRG